MVSGRADLVSGLHCRKAMILKAPATQIPMPAAREEVMITVALVEDSAPMRRNLERMLRRASGVRCVCSCASAEEALEQVPSKRPDVVLMDINLPGVSGIECTN